MMDTLLYYQLRESLMLLGNESLSVYLFNANYY